MALRDQPYLPLYVDRFANDENLRECSAAANGVHIRLMCLIHKAETDIYGTIKLKKDYENELKKELKLDSKKIFAEYFATAKGSASDKQHANVLDTPPCSLLVKYFALQFDKHFPYQLSVIESCLQELADNKVIYFDGIYLLQNGMIKQGILSDKRSSAGKNGILQRNKKKALKADFNAKKEGDFAKDFATAKGKANCINIITTKNKTLNSKDKGVSNNMSGGVGEPKKRGKRKTKKEENLEENSEQEILNEQDMKQQTYEVAEMLEIYLTSQKYSHTREVVAMKYGMDLGMLKNWAQAFNEFLVTSGGHLDDTGKTVRQENEWASHFNNWLGTQPLDVNPKNLTEEKNKLKENAKSDSSKSKKPNGASKVNTTSAFDKIDAMSRRTVGE